MEEGRDLLPPHTVDRTNLIDCYQALLLAALVEEDLLEVRKMKGKGGGGIGIGGGGGGIGMG